MEAKPQPGIRSMPPLVHGKLGARQRTKPLFYVQKLHENKTQTNKANLQTRLGVLKQVCNTQLGVSESRSFLSPYGRAALAAGGSELPRPPGPAGHRWGAPLGSPAAHSASRPSTPHASQSQNRAIFPFHSISRFLQQTGQE